MTDKSPKPRDPVDMLTTPIIAWPRTPPIPFSRATSRRPKKSPVQTAKKRTR